LHYIRRPYKKTPRAFCIVADNILNKNKFIIYLLTNNYSFYGLRFWVKHASIYELYATLKPNDRAKMNRQKRHVDSQHFAKLNPDLAGFNFAQSHPKPTHHPPNGRVTL